MRRLPKIDLHRHLLGSARPETLWEFAHVYRLSIARQPFAAFRNAVVHATAPRTLPEYIQPWVVFREVVRTAEDIRRIAFEAATDARLDGVRYVEFRGSLPGMPITDGTSAQTRIPTVEYLQAVADGWSAVTGVACKLVVSVTRHAVGAAEPALVHRYIDRFAEVLAAYRGDLVVGVDLSGLERGWPAARFTALFAAARGLGLPVTVHAGETEGPEEIWSAIDDLGATRIGHGTSAPRDPVLVEALRARGIVLEVCPSASRLVGVVPSTRHHPVIECVPPVPYVICTDNPTLNASTLTDELVHAATVAGMDAAAYAHAQFDCAARAAFAPAALASVLPE